MTDYALTLKRSNFTRIVYYYYYGQALANIIFCQDSVKIFELFPTKHHPNMYMSIAGILGFQYFYLMGESNEELNDNYPNVDL